MTSFCCYHKCWKGAHPAGHALAGFCCKRCVFKEFSQNDFEQVGRANAWYQSGRKHYKHCCNDKATQGRAERPVLTSAKVDEIMAYVNHGPTSQPASSSTQPAAASTSSLPWEDASYARLLVDSQNRPATVHVLRHVNIILKMPVVIITLTYEGSEVDAWMDLEFDKCLQLDLEFYRGLKFYGRAAELEPICEKRSAVSDGMQQVLNFMAREEWDSDTRFIFLEEDWRPHTADVTNPMSAKAVIECMVQIAIVAANHGMGDFVWMSWEQHQKHGMWPAYGNNAQVYTVPFVKQLCEYTKQRNPTGTHWDIYLLRYLKLQDGEIFDFTSLFLPSLL